MVCAGIGRSGNLPVELRARLNRYRPPALANRASRRSPASRFSFARPRIRRILPACRSGGDVNKTFCLVAVALAAAPAVTCAADDSFRLTVFGKNHDTPRVLLENTSTDAATIVDLQIALGDTSYDFDRTWAQSGAAHVKPTLLDPDHRNGLRRAQTLHYTFTGLGPGKHAGFTSELDRGAANNRVDYRHVLFDLGLANTDANALISVGFSDGKTLAGRIPDFTLTRAD